MLQDVAIDELFEFLAHLDVEFEVTFDVFDALLQLCFVFLAIFDVFCKLLDLFNMFFDLDCRPLLLFLQFRFELVKLRREGFDLLLLLQQLRRL